MTPAALRADLREKRAAFEAAMRKLPGLRPDLCSAWDDYATALRAAAHLPPDPVEEAFERYREAMLVRPRSRYRVEVSNALNALDRAILAEAGQ